MMENERLTHKRVNGIKEGYWSSAKKEALMQRLAEYEDTGFDPEEIKGLVDKIIGLSKLVMADWVPVEEQLPEDDQYILLSFANFSLPAVGHYEINEDGSGAFYLGDCNEEDTCVSQDLFVNAWMPLPGPYRLEGKDKENDT